MPGLLHDVTDTDCWAQNSSTHGHGFTAVKHWFLHKCWLCERWSEKRLCRCFISFLSVGPMRLVHVSPPFKSGVVCHQGAVLYRGLGCTGAVLYRGLGFTGAVLCLSFLSASQSCPGEACGAAGERPPGAAEWKHPHHRGQPQPGQGTNVISVGGQCVLGELGKCVCWEGMSMGWGGGGMSLHVETNNLSLWVSFSPLCVCPCWVVFYLTLCGSVAMTVRPPVMWQCCGHFLEDEISKTVCTLYGYDTCNNLYILWLASVVLKLNLKSQ